MRKTQKFLELSKTVPEKTKGNCSEPVNIRKLWEVVEIDGNLISRIVSELSRTVPKKIGSYKNDFYKNVRTASTRKILELCKTLLKNGRNRNCAEKMENSAVPASGKVYQNAHGGK